MDLSNKRIISLGHRIISYKVQCESIVDSVMACYSVESLDAMHFKDNPLQIKSITR